MKVVSQLKRTLSTVLAMMMVLTSVPQLAMPVLADELVEEVLTEASSISINATNESAEDVVVTVNDVVVTEDTVVEIATDSTSANAIVKVVAAEGKVLESAEVQVNDGDVKLADAVDGEVVIEVEVEDGDALYVWANAETACEHKLYYKNLNDDDHQVWCNKCGYFEVVKHEFDDNGRCKCGQYNADSDAVTLKIAYPSLRVFVKQDSHKSSQKITYKAATAYYAGKKVEAVYSISKNDAVEKFDRKTGKITLKKGALDKGDVVITVTGAKADDNTKTATLDIRFTTKQVANEYTSAIIATVSGDSYVNETEKLADKNQGAIVKDGQYVIVAVSENKAVYSKTEVAPAGLFSYKISGKKLAWVDDIDKQATFEVLDKGTTTIKVTPLDGSKLASKASTLKVVSKYRDLNPQDLILKVVTGWEWSEEEGEEVPVYTEVKPGKGISVNGLISDEILAVWDISGNGISGNDIANYSFKASLKDCKATYTGKYDFGFVLNELNKNGKTSAKAGVITVKGAKNTTPATFTIKNLEAPKAKVNKIVQNGKLTNQAVSQNFAIKATKDAAVSGNKVAIWVDASSYRKLKGVAATSYRKVYDAIGYDDYYISSNGLASVDICEGALDGVKAGSYQYKIVTYNAKDGYSAPTTLKVSVKNVAPKKAVVDINGNVEFAKTTTSANSVSKNIAFKPAGSKEAAKNVKLIKVRNAYFKGAKISANSTEQGYTNHFAEYFDIKLNDNADGFVIKYVGPKSIDELRKEELTGFITYKAPATYNGKKVTYVEKTVKITIKKK